MTSDTVTLPFGSWPSPITPESLAADSPRLDGARFVGGDIWWGESVPAEGGRLSVRSSRGTEVLPSPWSARSHVHEYGGGSWDVHAGGLVFVEASDQRVYLRRDGEDPVPLTEAGVSFGGLRVQQGRLFAVREDLVSEPHARSLVEISLDPDAPSVRTIVSGSGFFAHPALSPDGAKLAWVQWSAREMPWDAAQVVVADAQTGSTITQVGRAALQPEWIDDDALLLLDDPTDRWNIYRLTVSTGRVTALAPLDADTGDGLWVLGGRWYLPLSDGRIVAVLTNGEEDLAVIGTDGTVVVLELPLTAGLNVADVRGSQVLVFGAGKTVASGLWSLDVDAREAVAIRGGEPIAAEWLAPSRAVTFAGPHGEIHAFDYPPMHPDYQSEGPAPYVVIAHGGPTSRVSGAASPGISYFTSRGIGVLDVNYGGSTGYGRAYRERLKGNWGVVDVDDVIAAAQGLIDSGAADPQRIAIRGGSAGGWTALSALVRGGVFAAGISRYGVADLRSLAEETHDFEKYYLDGLVGPLPASSEVYIERSPLTHAGAIDVPVLVLQGEDDAVVLPAQSERIVAALAARGIDHEYRLFPGEGHGFRRAETIIAVANTELAFLGRVFGFTPAPSPRGD